MRREWELAHPEPRSEAHRMSYARAYTRRVDGWLDKGGGSCRFNDRMNVKILSAALTKYHRRRYHTGAFAVMPNHCHLIIRPFAGESLEKLLKAIKGATSRQINLRGDRSDSPLWKEESHDGIIRDEANLTHALDYIRDNPAKANLANETHWRC